jgi:hypothetical protein
MVRVMLDFAYSLAALYALIWIWVACLIGLGLFSVIIGNHRIRKDGK